jgi:hypothetical protein
MLTQGDKTHLQAFMYFCNINIKSGVVINRAACSSVVSKNTG